MKKIISILMAALMLFSTLALTSCGAKGQTLDEIKAFCTEQVETLWDEVKRFENPHNYYVDLSQKLWDIKHDLLKKNNID